MVVGFALRIRPIDSMIQFATKGSAMKTVSTNLERMQLVENCGSFDGDSWDRVCGNVLIDNRDSVNDTFRRNTLRAKKLWRKNTFLAYYRLKYNAKRKVVQRVIRKDLSSGLFCRHTPADDNFNAGFQPKMSGFSVRSAFGDIVNIECELPSTIEATTFERFDSVRIVELNRPTRKEHRKEYTRKIWRDGAIDTVQDARYYTEWVDRTVKVARLSNRVEFDWSNTPETSEQSAFREDSCLRWIEPRIGFDGELLPQNELAKCDDGKEIPSLKLDTWQLSTDGYILDTIPRYIVKSVLSSWRLNFVGGNAANNGGLRPIYSGKQKSDIRHEFVQECLQEIAVAHLECLRNIRKFTGILNRGLSRILTEFVRRYCAGGNNRDRQATIERTKRNANELAKKLAEFATVEFQDDTARDILKQLASGMTQTAIAGERKVSQQYVSKVVKETIALNRVLKQLASDAE